MTAPIDPISIDIVVDLDMARIDALVTALSPEFYADADAVRRAVRTRSSVNLVHRPTPLEVDLFIAGGTPLDASQLGRRLAVDLGEGRQLYIHPPEDILLQKLRSYRSGGEVSDRQWRDIAAIVRVRGAALDRHDLRQNATLIGVSDLLERALAEDESPRQG